VVFQHIDGIDQSKYAYGKELKQAEGCKRTRSELINKDSVLI